MARRLGQTTTHAADDAIPITFPRSDGDASRRPIDPSPTNDGHVNFHREVESDEAAHINWRVVVANGVAQHVDSLDASQTYILADWPSGYKLFDHNKGPRGNPRHDLYLFGSPRTLKFRSPNEFVPHAVWLFGNPSIPCACKYCGKTKYQREISEAFGLSTKAFGRAEAKTARHRIPVRRVPKPARQIVAPQQRTVVERNSDLRALATGRRLCRVGELVWVALHPPIQSPTPGVALEYWPALIQEIRVKCTAQPHAPGEPYSVVQTNIFRVKLLGVYVLLVEPESSILPYLGYIISDSVMDALRAESSPMALSEDLHELSDFAPVPPTDYDNPLEDPTPHVPPKFSDAVAPYALALQIAAFISNSWTLTDEWEFKPAPIKSITSSSSNTNVLTSALAQAFQVNKGGAIDPAKPPETTVTISTFAPLEYRYQGLWWGSERIWMDELVRIKPSRHDITPEEGQDDFYPPGPLAEGRCIFLRINSISAPAGHGDCRLAGPLFELVEADWEDPLAPPPPAPAPPPMPPLTVAPVPPAESGAAPTALASTSSVTTRSAPDAPRGLPQLSSPAAVQHTLPYRLPPPPPGYVFRQILPQGHEVVLELGMLAGRYYPGLLESAPLSGAIDLRALAPDAIAQSSAKLAAVNRAPPDPAAPGEAAPAPVESKPEPEPEPDPSRDIPLSAVRLLAIGGLVPGHHHAMECADFKLGRRTMALHADREARVALYQFWIGDGQGGARAEEDAGAAGAAPGGSKAAAPADDAMEVDIAGS